MGLARALRPHGEAHAERVVEHRLRQEDLVRVRGDARVERAVQIVLGCAHRRFVFSLELGRDRGRKRESEDGERETGGRHELEGGRGADKGGEVFV